MINLNQITFGYRAKQTVLENLSLQIAPGHIYGLLGRNGAGKSSLLHNICGLLFPNSGQCIVNGAEPQKRNPAFLQTVYLLPEEVTMPNVSIKSYLNVYAPFYPTFSKELFYSMLKEFEVPLDNKLNGMSLGQKKKVAIAFALATQAKVLLLDEPTNGLDIPSKKQFRRIIAGALQDDQIIIISTHQVRDLDSLIDHVLILEDKQIILNQPTESITEKLVFKHVVNIKDVPLALYTEGGLKGYAVVAVNTQHEQSKFDMEMFFNAVLTEKQQILFHNLINDNDMEFSTYRVWLLCKKQLIENRLIYLLGLLITAAGTGSILFNTTTDRYGLEDSVQAKTFSGTMLMLGVIFTATTLSQFNDKAKGIPGLMLPASALEKLVAALLFSLVLFPLVFFVVIYPLVIIMHGIDVGPMGHNNPLFHFEDFFTSFPGNLYIVIQAMVLLFSVFYKRYSVIKTALTITVIFIAITSLNNMIAKSMIKMPVGPPYVNTPDALPAEKWDPSTYIKGTVHKIYYDVRGKVLVDQMIKTAVAGPIVSTPIFDKVKFNNNIGYYGEELISGDNQHREVPQSVPFTVNSYIGLSESTNRIFEILLYLTVPIMWLATWFRLKETQL